MVQPSFPTLFGRPEVLPVGFNEQVFAQIAPFQSIIIPFDEFFEQLVLLVHPFLILVVFLQQIFGLINEQVLGLIGKKRGEKFPIIIRVIIGLNRTESTNSCISI